MNNKTYRGNHDPNRKQEETKNAEPEKAEEKAEVKTEEEKPVEQPKEEPKEETKKETKEEPKEEPKEEDLDDLNKSQESASNVWVPARNTVFTSIALSYAESIGADAIIVGWNGEEGATFPDNSKEYMEKFNELIDVGSPEKIKIEAPLIDLNKEEIVTLGLEFGAPME